MARARVHHGVACVCGLASCVVEAGGRWNKAILSMPWEGTWRCPSRIMVATARMRQRGCGRRAAAPLSFGSSASSFAVEKGPALPQERASQPYSTPLRACGWEVGSARSVWRGALGGALAAACATPVTAYPAISFMPTVFGHARPPPAPSSGKPMSQRRPASPRVAQCSLSHGDDEDSDAGQNPETVNLGSLGKVRRHGRRRRSSSSPRRRPRPGAPAAALDLGPPQLSAAALRPQPTRALCKSPNGPAHVAHAAHAAVHWPPFPFHSPLTRFPPANYPHLSLRNHRHPMRLAWATCCYRGSRATPRGALAHRQG